MVLYLSVFLTVAAALGGIYIFLKYRKRVFSASYVNATQTSQESKTSPRVHIGIFLKAAAVAVGAAFFLRVMYNTSALWGMSYLAAPGLSNYGINLVTVLLNWFTCAAALLVALAPFFKIKNINYLVALFSLPVTVLNAVFFWANLSAMLGAGYSFDPRIIFFAIEQGTMLVLCVIYAVKVEYKQLWEKKILFLELFGIIFLCLIAVMPSYTLKALFGPGPEFKPEKFNIGHRFLLYGALVIPLFLYALFRLKDLNVRKFICLFVCLGGLSVYVQVAPLVATFNDITVMPLHLCNTAMYILPLCIIFKLKRLFYFTLFINVAGALAAMVFPNDNVTGRLFDAGYVSYWYNHYVAFFMPFVLVSLGIFERAKLKQFIYSVSAFVVYFLVMVFINAWFRNYNEDVNYFFLNTNYIASQLEGQLGTWAQSLYVASVQFELGGLTFIFRPIYQAGIFIGMLIICAGLWFIYENIYDISSSWISLMNRNRAARAAEKEFFAVRTDGEAGTLKMKMFFAGTGDTKKNKEITKEAVMADKSLSIENFGKLYSGAKNFAARGINLEVQGGEIFGFLGPNGAGKSTLIKSIVGIQPMTEGRITVCGYDTERQSVETKRLIGFVPDNYTLYDNLTGREYVNYIADLYRVPKEVRNERINKLTSALFIADKFDRLIKTFSHGMKQKTAIIAALAHNPTLWVLDEPLAGLDPDSIFGVKKMMREHAAEGNIVFFSSHIIDVVENLCGRIAIIKSGRIAAVVSLKELKERGVSLEDYYKEIVGDAGVDTREIGEDW